MGGYMFRAKNHKGFTLIEILIATTILALVGVGAILVEKQFMAGGSTQKHRLQATALAQEGLSAVRAAFNSGVLAAGSGGYDGLIAGKYEIDGSGNLVSDSGDDGQKIELNNVEFTRTIEIPASVP